MNEVEEVIAVPRNLHFQTSELPKQFHYHTRDAKGKLRFIYEASAPENNGCLIER